jgi:crossover junction endonuclease MUS81
MELIIDIRERKLIDLLKEDTRFEDVKLTIKAMEIGDIEIRYQNPKPKFEHKRYTIKIERKTKQDLLASINDGRYHEQKYRLLDWQKQSINHSALYIIEEVGNIGNDNKPEPSPIVGSILNTAVRDHMGMLMSKNLNETVNVIYGIFHRLSKDPKKYVKEELKNSNTIVCNDENQPDSTLESNIEYVQSIDVRKKKEYLSKEGIFIMQLTQIPGISINIATLIQQKFKDLRTFITELDSVNEEKEKIKLLSEINMGQRRIGPKLSKNIIFYLS